MDFFGLSIRLEKHQNPGKRIKGGCLNPRDLIPFHISGGQIFIPAVAFLPPRANF
jgi:hypothetical protein